MDQAPRRPHGRGAGRGRGGRGGHFARGKNKRFLNHKSNSRNSTKPSNDSDQNDTVSINAIGVDSPLLDTELSDSGIESETGPLHDDSEPERQDRQDRFKMSETKMKRYEELKRLREAERNQYDKAQGQNDAENIIVGTCLDMCPEYERIERDIRSEVDVLERHPGGKKGSFTIDPQRAVKYYRRSAAGDEAPLPSDIRPPHILSKTLDYLFNELLEENPFTFTHAFIRNRTRAVRKDFVYQRDKGPVSIACHERIARYHIIALYEMKGHSGYSEQQELEQLRKTLQSLIEFYDDNRANSEDPNYTSPNEPEFRTYHVLTHLRDPEITLSIQRLPIQILDSPMFSLACRLRDLVQRNNEGRRQGRSTNRTANSAASLNFFSRFFKLVESSRVTFLMASLLQTHFNEIRIGAIKGLKKAFLEAHIPFPVSDLVRILGFDDVQEAVDAMNALGIEIVWDDNQEDAPVAFRLYKYKGVAPEFHEFPPEAPFHKSTRLVGSKMEDSAYSDIINIDAEPLYPSPSIPSPKKTKPTSQPAGFPQQKVSPTKTSPPKLSTGLNAQATPFVPKTTPTLKHQSAFSSVSTSKPAPLPTTTSSIQPLPAPTAPPTSTPSPAPTSTSAPAFSFIPKTTSASAPRTQAVSTSAFPGPSPLASQKPSITPSVQQQPPTNLQTSIIQPINEQQQPSKLSPTKKIAKLPSRETSFSEYSKPIQAPSATPKSSTSIPLTKLPAGASPSAKTEKVSVLPESPRLPTPSKRSSLSSSVRKESISGELKEHVNVLTAKLFDQVVSSMTQRVAVDTLSEANQEIENTRKALRSDALDEISNELAQKLIYQVAEREAMKKTAQLFQQRCLCAYVAQTLRNVTQRRKIAREEKRRKQEAFGETSKLIGGNHVIMPKRRFGEIDGDFETDEQSATRLKKIQKVRRSLWEPNTFLHTLQEYISLLYAQFEFSAKWSIFVILPDNVSKFKLCWYQQKLGMKPNAYTSVKAIGDILMEVKIINRSNCSYQDMENLGLVILDLVSDDDEEEDVTRVFSTHVNDEKEILSQMQKPAMYESAFCPKVILVNWSLENKDKINSQAQNLTCVNHDDKSIWVDISVANMGDEPDDDFQIALFENINQGIITNPYRLPDVNVFNASHDLYSLFTNLCRESLYILDATKTEVVGTTIIKVLLECLNDLIRRAYKCVPEPERSLDQDLFPQFVENTSLTLYDNIIEYSNIRKFEDDIIWSNIHSAFYEVDDYLSGLKLLIDYAKDKTYRTLESYGEVPQIHALRFLKENLDSYESFVQACREKIQKIAKEEENKMKNKSFERIIPNGLASSEDFMDEESLGDDEVEEEIQSKAGDYESISDDYDDDDDDDDDVVIVEESKPVQKNADTPQKDRLLALRELVQGAKSWLASEQ